MDMTEDEVRDVARTTLGLDTPHEGVRCGAGQLTTFNQLGFTGVLDKPDGWWLPDDRTRPAIILETKSTRQGVSKKKQTEEIIKNVAIVETQYEHVVGVLTDFEETRVFKGHEEYVAEGTGTLQNIGFYVALFEEPRIDKERIYELTARINNRLHYDMHMDDLYDRMIFTACALVAENATRSRAGSNEHGYANGGIWAYREAPLEAHKAFVYETLRQTFRRDAFRDEKASVLTDAYQAIVPGSVPAASAPVPMEFTTGVCEIAKFVSASDWNGEDVMGIFFNEFNRYKKKSENGQILTPEHITDLMYRILDVNKNDRVLDATCGTGGFLTKAMANMIREAGGPNTDKARQIRREQLFGIEMDRRMYALACANMLLHKDGKSNIEMLDASDYKHRTAKSKDRSSVQSPATTWMSSLGITKVMMNPPYEVKSHCMYIVENVLDAVADGALCGFVLPDKKLEKTGAAMRKRILSHHRLLEVIKLPDATFSVGTTTSIFVFRAHVPQDGHEFFACRIPDDGLVTVKNKGRHDVYGRWPAIEDYWVRVIAHKSGDPSCEWLDPSEHLSWQAPRAPFELTDEDLLAAAMDRLMYEHKIDQREMADRLLSAALYSSDVPRQGGSLVIGADDATN